MLRKSFLLTTVLFLLTALPALAKIGVGINNGKIYVTEKLKPGAIYNLPDFIVFNTGTDVSDYTISIKYNMAQTEARPDPSWFKLSPQTFTLSPHETKHVKATLTIPFNAPPGDYFAYIEASPVTGILRGVTAISVAAASKLYFTVIPANIQSALYYRLVSIFTKYAPWSYIIVSSVIIILIGFAIGKKFKLKFRNPIEKK